ncbi:hypothetical protein JL100_034050 (plasmid) [Skermanella mucosa]|uniref:hypothetical protein n=1 Tax=Skermanella mucosa TaxID=1789672 RepID=UPI00192AE383|nr:hypothetical protein [Skermanella mucosa]UEM24770.1 hypothetical protein JL100_034050 [Skermanella mucosa]
MNFEDVMVLRTALRQMRQDPLAWKASDEPAFKEIFAPVDHDGALDPDRALVVGNRGVGKSFWSSVLAHQGSRRNVSALYPRLNLERATIVLGFHEGSADGAAEGPAPSTAMLARLGQAGFGDQDIWAGVLVEALRQTGNFPHDDTSRGLDGAVRWAASFPEDLEAGLRRADLALHQKSGRFVLLFDAIDRLGENWEEIRSRTEAILRLALRLRSFRALRVKIFMRSDQFADLRTFSFPDASKLRMESVPLNWHRRDLYGLLFHRLWTSADAGEAFRRLVGDPGDFRADPAKPELPLREIAAEPMETTLPYPLRADERVQQRVFAAMAGEFMGTGPNKGKSYSWLHDHLADAAGETSLQSFLLAVIHAAQEAQDQSLVMTYRDIKAGVQKASQTRLGQLQEDHWWVQRAIAGLEGLIVPSPPEEIFDLWRKSRTVQTIMRDAAGGKRLPPILLADDPSDPEACLLRELINLKVVERRTNGRINMPDIFRVAAKIKRKGEIRPPAPPGRV